MPPMLINILDINIKRPEEKPFVCSCNRNRSHGRSMYRTKDFYITDGFPRFPNLPPPPLCTSKGDLFGYILDLTGGISASLVNLVLPALVYLQATRGINTNSNRSVLSYRRGSYALVIFGVGIIFGVPVSVILSFLGKR